MTETLGNVITQHFSAVSVKVKGKNIVAYGLVEISVGNCGKPWRNNRNQRFSERVREKVYFEKSFFNVFDCRQVLAKNS